MIISRVQKNIKKNNLIKQNREYNKIIKIIKVNIFLKLCYFLVQILFKIVEEKRNKYINRLFLINNMGDINRIIKVINIIKILKIINKILKMSHYLQKYRN
jgi:hypothetical protein